MPESQDVRILAWPEDEPVRVAHAAEGGLFPVRVGFDATPLLTRVTGGERPLQIAMRMAVSADEAVPLCVTVCEPLCVTSEYTVSIDVFDRPVASIRVRGTTRIAPCEQPTVVIRGGSSP